MAGRIKLTDAQKQIAQKYNPNIEAQDVSRPNWSNTYQKQQEQKSASAYEKRQSELAEQRRQAQVDLDVDTINRIDAELKALRAQAGQQTAADRIGDTIGASASGTVGSVANAAGTIINLFQDPEKNKRDIARLQTALAIGYTSDGKPVTAEQRKTIEESIARLQAQTAAWEKSDSTVNKMYNFADIADKDTERFTQSAKQGLGKVGQFAVDLGVGAGQLATDIAASALVPGAGTALMATRVFGGTTQDARQEGSSLGQQLAGGLGKAGVAVLTGKLANIAGPFKGAYGKGFLDDALSAITAKPAGKLVMSMLSEGSEEFIEALADPIIEKMTYNKDSKYDAEWFADALYSAAIGATLGLVGGVADVAQSQKPRNSAQGSSATIPIVSEGSNTIKAKAAQNAFKSDLSGNEKAVFNDGLGAANVGSVNTAYDNLQAQSDKFYPEGANVARPVDVPTIDASGNNISRVASNILGAKAIPDDVVPVIEQLVADGRMSYGKKLLNKSVLQKTEETIKNKKFDGALEQLRQDIAVGKSGVNQIAMATELLNNAANAKNVNAVAEICAMMQGLSTNAGRALQFFSVLRKLSPTSQLYGIQSAVNRINETITVNGKEVAIPPELTHKFMGQEDQAGRDAVMEEIYQAVADQVPATWKDKWNAWRYLAMLGNPRTHIRNTAGNAFFQPVRIIKNEIAAGLERIVGVKEKTKSFTANPALYRATWNDYSNVSSVLGNSKYTDTQGEIRKRQTVFNFVPLEAARKGNSKALEVEDAVFKRVTYADSLAGYLAANGVDAAQLESGNVDDALLSRARDYAANEALKATYQDSNAFSEHAAQVTKSLGMVGQAINPFTKTPANILARGLEYSPAGLVKSLTTDLAKVKRGDITASEAIDNISSGLTGTGLFALGAYLFANGFVTSSMGDEEEDKWNDLLGHQGYALELGNGASVTLDWLAPESLPFFMGVEFMSAVGENGWKENEIIDALWQATKSAANPMLELSMLQGVSDLIESVKYADGNPLAAMIPSVIVSYFSQAIPTLGGQIERSRETERMSTYTDKNNAVPSDLQYALGRASAKIPGWDYQQIPYIDAWGQTESTGDPLERAANNLFNPAYMSTVEVDKVESELQRLYDATGKSVFPEKAGKYFTVNGERKDLTADEYVKYAKAKGENSYKLVQQAQNSAAYKNMSNDQKAEFLDMMYAYADYKAKRFVESKYADDTYEKYERAEKAGMTPAEYYVMKQTYDYDGSNKNGNPTQIEAEKYLDTETDLTRSQKADLFVIINKSWEKSNPYD